MSAKPKIHCAGTSATADHGVQTLYLFFCPGCFCTHGFHVPHWTWNGSLDRPTFTPSILCNAHDHTSRCHAFVTFGRIQFLTDSHHRLAGETVELPDWEGEGDGMRGVDGDGDGVTGGVNA